MSTLVTALLLALLVLAPAGARAAPPAAAVVVDAETERVLGSATLLGGDRVLTARHVVDPLLRRRAPLLVRREGDDAVVRSVAVSDWLDLAVLVVDRPFGSLPVLGEAELPPGTPVVVPSPHGGGVEGVGETYPWRRSWGPALFARLPVGFGFSGAPVMDAEGGLLGLVVAAVDPDALQMTTLRGHTAPAAAASPIVLVLPIRALLAEAARIDRGCCRITSAEVVAAARRSE